MNNKVKIIIGIIGLGVLMTSCTSVKYTTTIGDITLLDNNGGIIREWDNSIINQKIDFIESYKESYNTFTSLKNGGLNFIDESGETHYISGGIIIVDNIKESINISTGHNYDIYEEKEKAMKESKENSYDPYDPGIHF